MDSGNGASTSAAVAHLDSGESLTRRAVTLPGQQPCPTYKVPIAATQMAPAASDTPRMTTHYEASNRPAQAILGPISADDDDPRELSDESLADDSPGQEWPAEPAARTHKIVDGDTLSRLAQRYLGSADRYWQIYDANRDVLRSPDLLPIGKVLRLPDPADHSPHLPRTAAASSSLDARSAQVDSRDVPQMIPIPQGVLRIRGD